MALSFFDKWSQRGARSVAEIASSLRGLATEQLKLDWLREQIEMRTRGLDFVEFRTRWSSGQDQNIGTVADLTAHLKEIITEEKRRRSVGELHKEAAVPTMHDAAQDIQGAGHADADGAGGRARRRSARYHG